MVLNGAGTACHPTSSIHSARRVPQLGRRRVANDYVWCGRWPSCLDNNCSAERIGRTEAFLPKS